MVKKLINSSRRNVGVRKVSRGDKRRKELAGIAEQIFLERGFSETTMQMIASRAGGSKETLYRHFASKEALFAEIVSKRAILISAPKNALMRDGNPEEVLLEMGFNLLRMIFESETASLFRIVVSEGPRSPELGAAFYAQGPGATLNKLTDYLRAVTRRGQLDCVEPVRAAKLFLGAVVAQHHLYSLIQQPRANISETEMRSHVQAAVAMFMARYNVVARMEPLKPASAVETG